MVVDLEIFEKNLNTMADHCRKAGLQLRGHVKVHKSPEIARRQATLGSIGVTCATVAECELMANAGIKGVLLTRQPTSKNNIDRFGMFHFIGVGGMAFFPYNYDTTVESDRVPWDVLEMKRRGAIIGYTISGCHDLINQTSFGQWSPTSCPSC